MRFRNFSSLIFRLAWLALVFAHPSYAQQAANKSALVQKADHFFDALNFDEALPLYRQAGQAGDAHACARLGLFYENGNLVKQDNAEALRWYHKADQLGDITAAASIGSFYQTGAGVPVNLQEALRWYQKGANAGDPDAMNHIGVLYSNGGEIPLDIPKALEWFHRAAAGDDSDAMLNLGSMYAFGTLVPRDYAQALQWFQKAAALGNSQAAEFAGTMYERGQGVPRNHGEAIHWFEKAGAMGDQHAIDVLHKMDPMRPTVTPLNARHPDPAPTQPAFGKDNPFTFDFHGEWSVAYPREAPRHPQFTLVAIQKGSDFQLIVGDPNIYYPIGESMFNGTYIANHNITGDIMDAPAHQGNGYRGFAWSKAEIQIIDPNHLVLPGGVKLTRKGELGANKLCEPDKYMSIPNAAAAFFIYANKDFELKNYGTAACWLYLSASQRHHEAQRQLALLLHFGTGVKQDDEQSFLWLKKSADQGNKKAELLLSEYYRRGIGVPKNNTLAQAALGRANSPVPEPLLPAAQGEQRAAVIGFFEQAVCGGAEALSDQHDSRVQAYLDANQNNRFFSRDDAEARASNEEADGRLLCHMMTGYKPPPMPPKP